MVPRLYSGLCVQVLLQAELRGAYGMLENNAGQLHEMQVKYLLYYLCPLQRNLKIQFEVNYNRNFQNLAAYLKLGK